MPGSTSVSEISGISVRQLAARAGALAMVLGAGSACTYVSHVHVHETKTETIVTAREQPRFPMQDPLDAVVRIASINGECSGTVVGDRLVISARACFDRITTPKTFPRDRVRARIGGGAIAWHVVPVIAVLGAPCTGVAVMVTDAPIPDAPPLRLRLGAEVALGEPLRVVGFGRCSGVSSGARVVGFAGHVRELGDHAFRVDTPACAGDAGGPLISEWTGEVVGVLQGEPVSFDGDGPMAASSGAGLAARVDAARGLLAQAFLVAHGVPAAELPPIACP